MCQKINRLFSFFVKISHGKGDAPKIWIIFTCSSGSRNKYLYARISEYEAQNPKTVVGSNKCWPFWLENWRIN